MATIGVRPYPPAEVRSALAVDELYVIDDDSRAALASGRAEPALALFIDSLMEMRGLSEFDCLGQWTEAKAKWSSEVRVHNFCYIFRPNLAGRILNAHIPLRYWLRDAIQRAKHSLGIVRRGHPPPVNLE